MWAAAMGALTFVVIAMVSAVIDAPLWMMPVAFIAALAVALTLTYLLKG